MIDITYILPIRSADLSGLPELTQYLQSLDVAQIDRRRWLASPRLCRSLEALE